MSCRVTGGEAFEQMLAPDLRKGVKSDQSEEKGCKHTDDKLRHRNRGIYFIEICTSVSASVFIILIRGGTNV